MVLYLEALNLTFSCPLLFKQFLVCQLFIKWPCLGAIGRVLGFGVKWGVVHLEVFLFFFFSKTAPCCSDPSADFPFGSIFEVCSVRYLKFVNFSLINWYIFTVSIVCRVFCLFPVYF